MSLRGLHPRHLALLGGQAAQYAIRGGAGILFLYLVLATGLIIASAVLSPVEQVEAKLRKSGQDFERVKLVEALVDQARPVVTWAVGEKTEDLPEDEARAARERNEAWVSYLLDERPAALSAIYLILLVAMPFLVAAGAFNVFSGDIQSRGLRFLLFRTERPNLFFGRFLGTLAFATATIGLLILTIALYIGLKLKVYAAGDLAVWALLGWLFLVVQALPYVALGTWFSCLVDSPLGSLAVSEAVIGAVPLFAYLGRQAWEPLGHLAYLSPWGIQNDLFRNAAGSVLLAVLLCLAYAAVFLFLGYRRFTRRDL